MPTAAFKRADQGVFYDFARAGLAANEALLAFDRKNRTRRRIVICIVARDRSPGLRNSPAALNEWCRLEDSNPWPPDYKLEEI